MPFPAGCIDTDSGQAPAIDRCLADSQVLGKFAAAGLSLLQQNSQTFSCWRKKTMKKWVFLALAIMGDVVVPCALKSANGFTRFVPSLAMLVGYSDAFHVLSRALAVMPVGIAYAVWAGLGTTLVAAVACIFQGQKLDAWAFSLRHLS